MPRRPLKFQSLYTDGKTGVGAIFFGTKKIYEIPLNKGRMK